MKRLAFLLGFVVACTRGPPSEPALVATATFPALDPRWVEETPFTHRTRVLCDVPDGGAIVSVFGDALAWREPELGCSVSPLACPTDAARTEVLRALESGTLSFPARRQVRTDADGWFTAELGTDSFLFVECGARAGLFPVQPPWLDQVWKLALEGDGRPTFPGDGERVLVINAFTRQTARLTRETWAQAPRSLLERAWVTTEPSDGGRPMLKLPLTEALGEDVRAARDGGLLAIRVHTAAALRRSPLSLSLRSEAGEEVFTAPARMANGADLMVAPGRWTLAVSMPGSQRVTRPVMVGAARTEVVVELVPALGSRGRVVDAQNRPVVGACVVTRDEWRWQRCDARSDVRGEFVLPPPDEGEQRLLRATQLALGSSELRPSGDPSPVLLQLAAHRQVRLDVHGADGGAPAVFNLRGDGRVEELFVPVHDGVITLADLPPGPYRLSLVSPDAWLRPLDLVMPDAGTVEQRLELLPLATVSGTVLEKGRPVAKVPVGSESARQPTQTDLQGRFLLEGLPHGAVKIFVGLKGQSMTVDAPARVEFELTTGSLRQGALDGG